MILAVTHHLDKAAEMDRIVVLKQGRVAEIGSHGQLLSWQGIYAEMWTSQKGRTISEDGNALGITTERPRRFTLSSGQGAVLSLMVVRTAFPRTDPASPMACISRSTVQRVMPKPSRFILPPNLASHKPRISRQTRA